MKRILLIACFLLSIAGFGQRKIGLIVAIGDYPEGDWKDLSSLNDVRYIKAALMKNGFSEVNLDTLLNQQATRKGIIDALDRLIARAKPGDIVIFHFSGHGQQIYDDNGDEIDGYDEALIPYDAAGRYDPVTYHGENHLRDDIVGEKLNAIRKKIGSTGSLVVLIDACHSGTAHRGGDEFMARGTPVPFNKPGYKPNIKVNFASGQETEFFGDGVGNMIVFSASSAHQVNFETRDENNVGVGSLSYAFAKAVSALKPGSTYQYLYEKIRAQIQAQFPQQRPMVEGNINQVVFGGDFIAPESYIGVNRWMNDTTVFFNAGFLNSVSKGSKFRLYALNDKDETTPLAEGYVSIAGTFQSVGVLDKKVQRGEAYKIVIDETAFADFSATLLIRNKDEKGTGGMLAGQIKNYIAPLQYLSIGDTPDYIFDLQTLKSGETKVELIDKSDSTRWDATVKKGDTLSSKALKQMLDNLKRAMRINYMRNLPDGGSMVQNVSVEITPLSPVEAADGLTMKPKDLFSIRIINKNNYQVFFNLLDITPDNEMKVLIPYEGKEADECVVQPNSEFFIEEVEVDQQTPQGREFMKFIFTRTPMDLRPVVSRSGTRGPKSSAGFENVMDDMFKDSNDAFSTRSNINSRVKPDEMGVLTRSFVIALPKQDK